MRITHRVRRTLATAAAGAMMLSLMPVGAVSADEHDDPCDGAPEVTFPDADSIADVHAANVQCMAAFGITAGTADGTFDPGGNVTRQQMGSFIARLAAQALNGNIDIPDDSPDAFDDVDATNVHFDAINWLADLGITTGVTETTYAPGDNVSREQMATFIFRAHETLQVFEALEEAPDTSTVEFTDIDDASDVHVNSILTLAAVNVIGGFEDGSFGPGEDVTRQQMSRFIVESIRVLDSVDLWNGNFIDPETGEPVEPEVPDTPDTPEPAEFELDIAFDPAAPTVADDITVTTTLSIDDEDADLEVDTQLAIFGFTEELEDVLTEDGLIDVEAEENVFSETVANDEDGEAVFDVGALPEGTHLAVAWSQEDETFDPAEAIAAAVETFTVSAAAELTFTTLANDVVGDGGVEPDEVRADLAADENLLALSTGEEVVAFQFSVQEDSFFIDGTPASPTAFLDAMEAFDTLIATPTADGFEHNLVEAEDVTGGVIGNSDATDFALVEPASGLDIVDLIDELVVGQAGSLNEFTVDGEAATADEFLDNLSIGDTLAIEILVADNANDPDLTESILRHNLVNADLEGQVVEVDGTDEFILVDVNPDDAGDPSLDPGGSENSIDAGVYVPGFNIEELSNDDDYTLTIDGDDETVADFDAVLAALENGDNGLIEYGRVESDTAGVDGDVTIAFDSTDAARTFEGFVEDVAGNVNLVAGSSFTTSIVATDDTIADGDSAIWSSIRVDNTVTLFADLDDVLSAGDAVSLTIAFGETSGILNFTTQDLAGEITAYADPNVTVTLAPGQTVVFNPTDIDVELFGYGGTTTYVLNGDQVTQAQMVTALGNIDFDDDDASLVVSGDDDSNTLSVTIE